MQAGATGAPGNAPANNLTAPLTAVIFPAFVAPILKSIDPPEVGPLARKTSSLVIVILTGLPTLLDNRVANGSR
jgi:hypothetical protein